MTASQKQRYDELLTHCVRIDELASTLVGDAKEEHAKPILEDDLLEMSLNKRRRYYGDIRVALGKFLRNHDPGEGDLDFQQWRADFNGYVTNLRILVDAIQGRIPLPASNPDETPDAQDMLKKELYWEQHGRCNGCGVEFPPRNYEVDHVVPIQLGGDESASNKQLLCPRCNGRKGQLPMSVLWQKLQKEGAIFEIPRNVPQRIRGRRDSMEFKAEKGNGATGKPFRQGTDLAKVYDFLMDGKAHAIEEIAAACGLDETQAYNAVGAVRRKVQRRVPMKIEEPEKKRYRLVPLDDA